MKPFTAIASMLLAIVALLHLLRFIQAWPVFINGMQVPVWASAILFVLSLALSILLWRERRR